MTVTASSFRTDLPEFADVTRYPGSQVGFYITLAGKLVDSGRWGDVFDQGVELFTAHWLVLWRERMDAAARGGVPGKSVGVLNNKSVDKVSAGYDVATGTYEGAGHWNLTTYGTQFYQLMQMFGAGPQQAGVPGPEEVALAQATAWTGPPVFLTPNPSG